MDAFINPDTWKQQWAVFMSAPYIVGSFILGAGLIGWWLRGIRSGRRIDGLEAESKLADKRAAWANEIRDDITRQFRDFKAEIAAGAGNDALAARIAKLEASLNALTGILSATEEPDIANFRGTVE